MKLDAYVRHMFMRDFMPHINAYSYCIEWIYIHIYIVQSVYNAIQANASNQKLHIEIFIKSGNRGDTFAFSYRAINVDGPTKTSQN